MKIISVTDEAITFDNGKKITFDHCADCCEYNYADFQQIEELALTTDFDESTLEFEEVEDAGFRFRSANTYWFFIPCYSDQNGYYSTDIEIYYDGKEVLWLDCPYA